MFGWLRRKKPEPTTMTTTMDLGPDPLNHSGDGTIRPGDPGWELFEHVIKHGGVIANRKDDGTWDVRPFSL